MAQTSSGMTICDEAAKAVSPRRFTSLVRRFETGDTSCLIQQLGIKLAIALCLGEDTPPRQ
jgi:hypothetical protein